MVGDVSERKCSGPAADDRRHNGKLEALLAALRDYLLDLRVNPGKADFAGY